MSFVRVVAKGFAQWKRHPDAASQPPLLCPWLLGIPDPRDLSNGLGRSWERAQIQQILRRTDN